MRYILALLTLTVAGCAPRLGAVCRHDALSQYAALSEVHGNDNTAIAWLRSSDGRLHAQAFAKDGKRELWADYDSPFLSDQPRHGFKVIRVFKTLNEYLNSKVWTKHKIK